MSNEQDHASKATKKAGESKTSEAPDERKNTSSHDDPNNSKPAAPPANGERKCSEIVSNLNLSGFAVAAEALVKGKVCQVHRGNSAYFQCEVNASERRTALLEANSELADVVKYQHTSMDNVLKEIEQLKLGM